MTDPSSACVAIARPYGACVRGFSGDLADGAHVRGTPGQRFRTLADTTASKWQVQQDTANAVWVHAHPGFKSPSLRRSQALSLNTWGEGFTRCVAKGCSSGRSCAHPWWLG
jgi:hypothetical protein